MLYIPSGIWIVLKDNPLNKFYIPSVSVALATTLVSFSLRLVFLQPLEVPLLLAGLVYIPVPKEMID